MLSRRTVYSSSPTLSLISVLCMESELYGAVGYVWVNEAGVRYCRGTGAFVEL
jgi:hypothetical protein